MEDIRYDNPDFTKNPVALFGVLQNGGVDDEILQKITHMKVDKAENGHVSIYIMSGDNSKKKIDWLAQPFSDQEIRQLIWVLETRFRNVNLKENKQFLIVFDAIPR